MRDLVGYGGNDPDLNWPNGARLAISLVINFEEGAEQQVADGDERTERIGEVLSAVDPGAPDMGQAQIFAYGMRAGLWRHGPHKGARTQGVDRATDRYCQARDRRPSPGVSRRCSDEHQLHACRAGPAQHYGNGRAAAN
jgi:hypothetical protein